MTNNDKARTIISRITAGENVSQVRNGIAIDASDWFRLSAKAYSIFLKQSRKIRKEDAKKTHVSSTSNAEIEAILVLNSKLSAYALCLPSVATKSDLIKISAILPDMPKVERELLYVIEGMTLAPTIRARQNIGRIYHFKAFREFARFVEAATLCYYRCNYASAYLTLVPVIEGIILRWSGYQGHGQKPDFEEIRKFFRKSHVRQPCPANPLFHHIYCKACDKIINDHLYRPSQRGTAYAEFNRHQAAHLLRTRLFATQDNCIRLFLLLDTMAEIYLYETACRDPRLQLTAEDTFREVTLYSAIQSQMALGDTPEKILL